MAKNPYGKLHLDKSKVEACLAKYGAEQIAFTKRSETEEHIYLHLEDKPFLMRLYSKRDGSHSLGKATGYCTETFEYFASKIADECKISEVSRFEFSTKNISEEELEALIELLIESDATIEHEKKETHVAYKATGSQGDKLTIKRYNNGTTQFQGKLLRISIITQDFLSNVLSLGEALQSQIQNYKIPATIDSINAELTTKIPRAIDQLEEAIKTQLSSALAMTKVELPVEDHSAVAFPALRGLEGLIKTFLLQTGFSPEHKTPVGEYFPNGRMDADRRAFAGDKMANVLDSCYTFYSQHRHRLFHMDVQVSTSRILDRQEAVQVVDSILSLIEHSYAELS
ncbi:MAG: type II toxin-antitoxin system RnlA family toxin [Pseudomonadota bacterium]